MRIIIIFFLLSVFCEVKTQSIDTLFVFLNDVDVDFRSQKIQKLDFENPDFNFSTFPQIRYCEEIILDTLSDGRFIYKGLPCRYEKIDEDNRRNKVENYKSSFINIKDSLPHFKEPFYNFNKFQLNTYLRVKERGCYVRRKEDKSKALIFYFISGNEDTTELSNLIQDRFNNNSLDPCFKNPNIKPCPMKVTTNEKLVKSIDPIRFNLNYIELIPYKKDAALEVNQFHLVNEELIEILNRAKVIYLAIGNPQSIKSRFNKVSFQYNQENISSEMGNCNIPFTSPSIL